METGNRSQTRSPLVDRYIVPLLVGCIVAVPVYAFLWSVAWALAGFVAGALFWYWYRGRHV